MASEDHFSEERRHGTYLELELVLFNHGTCSKTFPFIFFFFLNEDYLRSFQKKYLNFLKKHTIYSINPGTLFSKNSKILEFFLLSKNIPTLKRFLSLILSYFTNNPVFFLLKITKSLVVSKKKDNSKCVIKKKFSFIELDKQFPTYLRNSIIRSTDIGFISHFHLTQALKKILSSKNLLFSKKKRICIFCLYKRLGLITDSILISKFCIKLFCLNFIIKNNFFSCLGASQIFIKFFIKFLTKNWNLKKNWRIIILKFFQTQVRFFRVLFLDNFFQIFVSEGLDLSLKKFLIVFLEIPFFGSSITDLLSRIFSYNQLSPGSLNKVIFQINRIKKLNYFSFAKEDSKQFFSRGHCSIEFEKKKEAITNIQFGKKIRNEFCISYFGSKCFIKKKNSFFLKKCLLTFKNEKKSKEETVFYRAEKLERRLYRIDENYPKHICSLDFFFSSFFIEVSIKKIKNKLYSKLKKKREGFSVSLFQTAPCLTILNKTISKILDNKKTSYNLDEIFFLFFLILCWDSNRVGKAIYFFELVFRKKKNSFCINIIILCHHLYGRDVKKFFTNRLEVYKCFKKKTLVIFKKKNKSPIKIKNGEIYLSIFRKNTPNIILEVHPKSKYLTGNNPSNFIQEKKESTLLFKIKNFLIKKHIFTIFSENDNFPIILIRLNSLVFFFTFSKDRILENLKNLSHDFIRFRKSRLFWILKIKGFELKKLKIPLRNHWSLLIFNYSKLNLC